MKITKSRLLQIIREEVELHEENNLELDEEEVSKQEFKNAIEVDQKEAGLANEQENLDVEEDQLLDPESKKVIKPPKNTGKIEIKIR